MLVIILHTQASSFEVKWYVDEADILVFLKIKRAFRKKITRDMLVRGRSK